MSIIILILFIGSLILNVSLLVKCSALTYLYNYLLQVLQNTKVNILNLKGCLKNVVTLPELSKTLDVYFDDILEPITSYLNDEYTSKR